MPDAVGLVVLVLLVVALYLLPSLIATSRHKRNAGAIFLLNLFLGWTVLGWVIALIWAALHEERRAEAEKFTVSPEGRRLPWWRKR